MVWSYLSVQLESSSDFCEVFFFTSLQFELFKLSTWTLMGVERVTVMSLVKTRKPYTVKCSIHVALYTWLSR